MTLAGEVRLMKVPVARAQMLIRRPVAEVFEAIVNPEVTSNFWFSRGSQRLEPGNEVEWIWESYGASAWGVWLSLAAVGAKPRQRRKMDSLGGE